MPQSLVVPYICIQDQKTNGTSGGGISSGSWVTRTLNTIVANDLGLASLASNQILLPPGTYRTHTLVPGFACDAHQSRLFSVTGNNVLVLGPNSRAAVSSSNYAPGLVVGRFVLLSTQAVRVEQQIQTTNATNGAGMAMSFGGTEIYTTVELWKEG